MAPAVRERKEAVRLVAARPARSAESVKRVYPSWRFHRTKPAVVVEDPQAEADLGDGRADRPNARDPIRAALASCRIISKPLATRQDLPVKKNPDSGRPAGPRSESAFSLHWITSCLATNRDVST